MTLNKQIITAGVYVLVADFFVFQVGPTSSGETLGVVRLGGHREGNETGWECAAREALEEASLHIVPLKPPATYWASATGNLELQPGKWSSTVAGEVSPILVTRRNEETITPIYLAYAQDIPRPDTETKALLLLCPLDIQQIVMETVTLEHYLERGGKVVFREKLPRHLILEPFVHLRLLHKLLQLHPEIIHLATEFTA